MAGEHTPSETGRLTNNGQSVAGDDGMCRQTLPFGCLLVCFFLFLLRKGKKREKLDARIGVFLEKVRGR